jgi:hypothetical protein
MTKQPRIGTIQSGILAGLTARVVTKRDTGYTVELLEGRGAGWHIGDRVCLGSGEFVLAVHARPPLWCQLCDTVEALQHSQPCLNGFVHGFVTRPPVTTLASQMAEFTHYNPMCPQQTWPTLARFLGED